MDQQLVMGIVLIVVGLAFGLIAAAVVVNRRIDAHERAEQGEANGQAEASGSEEGQAQAAQADAGESAADSEKEQPEAAAEAARAAEPEPGATGEVPPDEVERHPDHSPPEAAEPEPVDAPPADADPEPAVASAKETAGETPDESLLGELHRDPQTGEIFFRRGDREYRSPKDIPDRDERDRLAGVAKDWAAWFREPVQQQPAAGAVPTSTSGMVQAIDAILQRSLQKADVSTRGVRLVQDISGGVKVLIGVKSYEVEDVPDEEIKRLIRQAVAEWEGRQ